MRLCAGFSRGRRRRFGYSARLQFLGEFQGCKIIPMFPKFLKE